jgi:VIT1/CCC1 family predicted Fe2+/Mn2+ transporter
MNMRTTELMRQSGRASANPKAMFSGAYYMLTLLTCVFVFYFHGQLAFAADLFVTIFYLAVTALFYGWSKQRNNEKVR